MPLVIVQLDTVAVSERLKLVDEQNEQNPQ